MTPTQQRLLQTGLQTLCGQIFSRRRLHEPVRSANRRGFPRSTGYTLQLPCLASEVMVTLHPLPAGNLLMVSNYPSETAYAWWLMEHFWKTLAEQFSQNERQAYLAFPRIATMSDTVVSAPAKTVELVVPGRTLKEIVQVHRFIHDHRITVLYLTDRAFFSINHALLRLSGIRCIIIHDHTPGDRPPIRGLKGAMKAARNALPWFTAERVLCVSELMRQRNLSNQRIPERKCVVVQNGIPPVVCQKSHKDALRQAIGVRPDTLLVITTGRAHPYKRFDFVIDCAAAFRQVAPDLDTVFLLVGDGPAMPDLQAQVRRLGLENAVRLLGIRADVRELLCASDIAMHAALGEGFSLSIIEYMSASLPVLVPDIPSVCQAVHHDETGLIYPWNDEAAAAALILSLATHKNRRFSMGQVAKEVADREYNLERCTRDFVDAIEAVCPWVRGSTVPHTPLP